MHVRQPRTASSGWVRTAPRSVLQLIEGFIRRCNKTTGCTELKSIENELDKALAGGAPPSSIDLAPLHLLLLSFCFSLLLLPFVSPFSPFPRSFYKYIPPPPTTTTTTIRMYTAVLFPNFYLVVIESVLNSVWSSTKFHLVSGSSNVEYTLLYTFPNNRNYVLAITSRATESTSVNIWLRNRVPSEISNSNSGHHSEILEPNRRSSSFFSLSIISRWERRENQRNVTIESQHSPPKIEIVAGEESRGNQLPVCVCFPIHYSPKRRSRGSSLQAQGWTSRLTETIPYTL